MTLTLNSLIEGILASLIAIIVVSVFNLLKKQLSQRKLKKVLGLNTGNRSLIVMTDRDENKKLIASTDAYAVSYMYSLINQLKIKSDIFLEHEVNKQESFNTIFCIGSPVFNKMAKNYFKMHLGNLQINIRGKPGDEPKGWTFSFNGKEYQFDHRDEIDYAVLAKINIDSHNRRQTLFLFAGLTGYGTEGAAFYLSHHAAKSIYKTYEDKSFCLVLERKVGMLMDTISIKEDLTPHLFNPV